MSKVHARAVVVHSERRFLRLLLPTREHFSTYSMWTVLVCAECARLYWFHKDSTANEWELQAARVHFGPYWPKWCAVVGT